jgi:hypothetical protein
MRLFKTRLVVLLCICLVLVSISGVGFAASSTVDLNVITESELSKNVKYRENMGLNTNVDYVKKVMSDSKSKVYVEHHGVALTPAEAKDIERRINMQKNDKPKVKSFIENHVSNDDFSGLYIDQKNGGILKVGFTQPLSQMESIINQIKSIFPEPQYLSFYQANNSEEKLTNLHKQVFEQMEHLKDRGIEITGINTNIVDNKVDVGIKSLTEEKAKVIFELFGKDSIHVFEKDYDVSTARNVWNGYLEAGLQIEKDTGSYCTSNISIMDANWDYFIVTAGHCIRDYSGRWFIGGHDIGYGAMWNTGDADVGAIRISDQHTYWMYIDSTKERDFRTKQLATEDDVGDYVCQSSATTGYACGYIQSTNYTSSFDGYTYTNQRLANYAVDRGDSGGPVFLLNTIMGIQSAMTLDTGEAVYSHIDLALQNLGEPDPTPILNN